MADIVDQLNENFASVGHSLEPDLISELTSILRVYSLSPEELKWRWDSYCIRLGNNDAQLDLLKAQELRSDLQDGLERDSREKAHVRTRDKRVTATPKVGSKSGDVFGMLDGLVPNTPHANGLSKPKRKADFDTPSTKAMKNHALDTPNIASSPLAGINGTQDRSKSGTIQETLNSHIDIPSAPAKPPAESRIKLKANTEMAKFAYKSMAVKLSEASEILDDRIDEFAALIKEYHKLDDETFGNPCFQSPNEVVAVGRIACDSSEGRLNVASALLETSRRAGAGMRIPLKFADQLSYDLFPGKIVALKGVNPSGDFFTVSEVLELPALPPAASSIADLDVVGARMRGPDAGTRDNDDMNDADEGTAVRALNVLVASGPYTTDIDLDFSGLQTLITEAIDTCADSLILFGPFIDSEHPQIMTGDFDLPPDFASQPDKITLTDLFKYHISSPLQRLAQKLPGISIIMVPSVRDAIAKHVSWPQDRVPKKDLGLPKQAQLVTNPVTLSINELVVGLSSLDALEQLRATTLTADRAKSSENLLARLVRQMIDQRHFFPVYPALDRKALAMTQATSVSGDSTAEQDGALLQPMTIGAPLDLAYLKLAEWLYVKPDLLMVPSSLPPFAKVVNSVLAVNPGTVMKRKGAGTFARMTIAPLHVSEQERQDGKLLAHNLWERSRVDIIRT